MVEDMRNILNVVAMGLQLMNEVINSSSSSENSENEEFEALHGLGRKTVIPRVENYVEHVIPALSNQEFKSHFRMGRETFDYILSIIGPRLKRLFPGTAMISPEKQFLIAIWRLATPDSLRSICERFNVGRSTALYITRRVTRAVNELSPVFIRWPTEDKVQQIWAGFEAVSGFPKVIGAIDGTHINIPAPSANPESYINRKGCHSVILQAVCDHSGCFLHCYAGHVGSVHDQLVFRLSEVYGYLGDAEKFPEDSHLIGDSAYKLHENLLVPYRDNGHLTERQRNYNFCHSSARMAIERSFGTLKGRFRLTVLPMRKIDSITTHIIACCGLHSICSFRGDDLLITINEGDADNIPRNVNMRHDVAQVGVAKRDLVCQRLLIRDA
ncbi:hypothetical protein NQ315_003616 [Exocentrus adspersus]|uniref:Putative nuclease HARBI1 n=1 Tax=Exocentrus adspersus TaxID=1586481 RepID=A0AAV8VIU1_9CUCU|nr:hypothetical protein NQ315_003616 [Exocentrus adspersus]